MCQQIKIHQQEWRWLGFFPFGKRNRYIRIISFTSLQKSRLMKDNVNSLSGVNEETKFQNETCSDYHYFGSLAGRIKLTNNRKC